MHVYAPYLESKFNTQNASQTVYSDDTLPGWLEVKIRHRPSFAYLFVYLFLGQILAAACSTLVAKSESFIHIIFCVASLVLWLYLTVAESSMLISRPFGVQSSCRYFWGQWKRSPLIPVNRIRTIHLVDRVTNTSVRPFLCLEMKSRRGASYLEPLFCLEPCLPLHCLVTIYRLVQAVLLKESGTVPSAF